MFPIRDHNPSGRIPFVTYILMAANIGIFLSYVPILGDERAIGAFYNAYALVPARIGQGYGFEGLFTSMFLHGGWMHLAGNMLFLWIYGDNVEDEMGHIPFLLFYLVVGVAAGLTQVAIEPTSRVPMVGASGAIAGVMGAYLLLFPKAQVDILVIFIVFFRIFPIPAWILLTLWFGMQFLGGIGADPNLGGVAYWAHAGGFAAGLIGAIPLWMKRGATAFWRRTDGHPPHPETKYPRINSSRIPKVRRR
ncbi:rhomboid family intramembrane serine protease [Marimonas sp. MJW-29]|uniref:Rhomboid family intramembrane serine protease n=1 Tax=Sulfitobacter sediminis TaxID=3234186 RepID=A0ABV3RKG0_9RHOB